MAKVAINGFGRIGRTFFKMAESHPDFDIVAINDLGDINNLAYLLKYDTVYGMNQSEIEVKGNALIVNGKEISFIQERDPKALPWGDMGIEVVVEATGIFASYEKSKMHIEAGAKRVVVSGPIKDDPKAAGVSGATVLMGVNDATLSSCDGNIRRDSLRADGLQGSFIYSW